MKILDTISITISELDRKVNTRYTGAIAFIYHMSQGGIGSLQVINLKGSDQKTYNGKEGNKEYKEIE